MKKILLALAGAGLLASCGDVVVDYDGLTMTGLSNIRTNWTLSSDVVDQNGKTLKAGTPVICDNKITNVEADISWTGTLSKLDSQVKGLTTGDYKNVSQYPYGGVTGSGSTTATFTIGAGMAPLSLKGQAIIVNPVPAANVTVKGYTYLRVQGHDLLGGLSNIKESPNEVPVLDCGA